MLKISSRVSPETRAIQDKLGADPKTHGCSTVYQVHVGGMEMFGPLVRDSGIEIS